MLQKTNHNAYNSFAHYLDRLLDCEVLAAVGIDVDLLIDCLLGEEVWWLEWLEAEELWCWRLGVENNALCCCGFELKFPWFRLEADRVWWITLEGVLIGGFEVTGGGGGEISGGAPAAPGLISPFFSTPDEAPETS